MIVTGRLQPERVCDKCGLLVKSGEGRMCDGRWICYRHDHYISYERADKVPYQTFPVKTVENARPFSPRNTYEAAEYEVFNLLTRPVAVDGTNAVYPFGYAIDQYQTRDFAPDLPQTAALAGGGVFSAAWTGIYLYELIREARRPAVMIAAATAKLREVADFLLTRQYAAPHVANASTEDDGWWGGFHRDPSTTYPSSAFFFAHHCAAAGLALLRAWQVHGDAKYLGAARAAVWFCRTMQCAGKLSTGFSAADIAATQRKQFGPWADLALMNPAGVTWQFTCRFVPYGLLCAVLFQEFRSAVGDELIGSPNAGAGAMFSQSRQSTIQAAIDEGVNWWKNGEYDLSAGRVIKGFSAEEPFQHFAGSTPSYGNNNWRYAQEALDNGYITADAWGIGIYSLLALGETTLATALFDFLMTFNSNPELEAPAAFPDKVKYGNLETRGTYDPRLALADEMEIKAGGVQTLQNSTINRKAYALYSAGLMAQLYSTRQPEKFKELKDELCEPRHHSVGRGEDGRYHYLQAMGRCGFSFQPTQANFRGRVPFYVAMIGLLYRFEPKAFTGAG